MNSRATQSFQRSKQAPRSAAYFSVAVLCAGGMFCGCSMVRKRPTVAWGSAIQARPRLVAERQIDTTLPDPAPELELRLPSLPSPIVIAPPPPARARIPAAVPSVSASSDKPEAPRIAPQLTAQEAANAREQIARSTSIAEKNLEAASGKSLNPTQMDLASKVRSFLSDSRDAGRAGDWIRARDLARKAQVLSEELASSL